MTGINEQEIQDRMAYHPATPEVATKYDQLRKAAIAFASSATALTPAGREQSLMVTHIEDALMWGSKAIARTTPADLTDTARVARVLPAQVDQPLSTETEVPHDDVVSLGTHPGETINVEPAVAEPTAAGLPVQPQTTVGYPGQTRKCQCGDVNLSVSEPDYIEGGKRHVVAPGTCVTL